MSTKSTKKNYVVLLIEDNLGDAKLFEKALLGNTSHLQFTLLRARSLEEGLNLIQTKKPDIVFLDLNLPDSIGYDTFSKLYDNAPNLPVVVLSSTGTEDIAMRTVEAGGQDYIFKENIEPHFLQRTLLYAVGRMKIIRELQEARTAAEKLATVKTEFLANMSHEIRTPMNGIIGMTSILLGSNLNEEQKECVATIRNSGDVLLKIINDILDLSKLEAGKMTMDLCDFKLRPTIEETVELFGELAHQKGIHLTNIIDPTVPSFLNGDAVRFRQVLSNLVSNAIKFTDHGNIVIRAKQHQENNQDWLRIEVHDTGIGVPPDKQHLLFQPFSQCEGSSTRKFGGTGLGLVISKRIVESMGGMIGMQNMPGSGSCFWFNLPLVVRPKSFFSRSDLAGKKALIVTPVPSFSNLLQEQLRLRGLKAEIFEESWTQLTYESIRSFDLVVIDAPENKTDKDTFKTHIETLGEPAGISLLILMYGSTDLSTPQNYGYLRKPIRQSELYKVTAKLLTGKKQMPVPVTQNVAKKEISMPTPNHSHLDPILVVEDNEMNQRVVKKMLSHLGYETHITSSGEEAIATIQKKSFSLVLMDCQMPGMDGFETTRRIRALEGNGYRVPILALTAYALTGDKEKCEACGMDDYLTKPLKMEYLDNILQRWLSAKNINTQKTSTESETLLLDNQILLNLRALTQEGESDFLNEIIETYLDVAPNILVDLTKAVEKKDLTSTRLLAHRLKGMSNNLGATAVASLCENLQNATSIPSESIILELQKQFQSTKGILINTWKKSA